MEKKVKPLLQIPGTKVSVQNAQLLISSGIQSLDEIIGGGFPIGTIVLVQEDVNCNYAKFLLKYFLAEGIAHKHPLFVASKDISTTGLVRELPKATRDQEQERTTDEDTDTNRRTEQTEPERMKIAFRYKNLPSTTTNAERGGLCFDLSTHVSAAELSDADISHWSGTTTTSEAMEAEEAYSDLLQSVRGALRKRSMFLADTSERRSVLRIAVHSVGSPSWRTDDPERDDRAMRKFFLTLRALIRQSFAVAMVTVPGRLWNAAGAGALSDRCTNASDICLRLHAFSGTELETNASLSKYHGFFYVDKIAAINSLTSKYQGPVDYAFKLLRRKLCIETLHLPPELQESTEREQDDLITSVSCGSGSGHGRRLLDF